MARNVTHVSAPPKQVFEVLSDGRTYGHWVVGSRQVREVEPGFPSPGTKIHHQVGIGPLHLNDETEVLEAVAPSRLVLQAKLRPVGTQRVTMQLDAEGRGTRVTMIEEPGDLLTRLAFINPLADWLLGVRNAESLKRLMAMAEGRGPSAADAAAPSV